MQAHMVGLDKKPTVEYCVLPPGFGRFISCTSNIKGKADNLFLSGPIEISLLSHSDIPILPWCDETSAQEYILAFSQVSWVFVAFGIQPPEELIFLESIKCNVRNCGEIVSR